MLPVVELLLPVWGRLLQPEGRLLPTATGGGASIGMRRALQLAGVARYSLKDC